jgi:hypothetical protein
MMPTTPSKAIFSIDFIEIPEHKTMAKTVPKISRKGWKEAFLIIF